MSRLAILPQFIKDIFTKYVRNCTRRFVYINSINVHKSTARGRAPWSFNKAINRGGKDYIPCSMSQLLCGEVRISFQDDALPTAEGVLCWKMISANSWVIWAWDKSLLVYYFSYFLIHDGLNITVFFWC